MVRWSILFWMLGCAAIAGGCGGRYQMNTIPILAEIQIELDDPQWDGKTIAPAQRCRRFGGNGSTPALRVTNIPSDANVLVLEFSDKSFSPMDKGGHGIIGYRIPNGTNSVSIPAIAGHTFDLPAPFFVIAAHRKPAWDVPGAYLPPCSGGTGNLYYIRIQAISDPDVPNLRPRLLGQGKLFLGRY